MTPSQEFQEKIKFLEGVASRSALQIVVLYVGTTDVLDIPDIA